MKDRTLEETVYIFFTTRAFATGVPTSLAGTPVVSAYPDDSATQITAGITLGVDHDGVTGLNLLTIVATTANGYVSGSEYALIITTGTVGGTSVVGEVVGGFSLSASASAVDLANATDGLGAIKAVVDLGLLDTNELQSDWEDGGRLDLILDARASQASVDNIPTVAEFEARTLVSGSYGTAANQAILDGKLDDIPTTAEFEARTLLAAAYGTAALQTTLDGKLDDIQGATFNTATDSLEAIRDRGDAEWLTGAGGSSPTVEEIRAEIDTNSTQLAALIIGVGTTIPGNQAILDGKLDDIQGATFNTATDSLEAIRDRGDAEWLTGAGGSSPTVEEIRAEIDTNSTQLAALIVGVGTTLPGNQAILDGKLNDIQGAGFDTATDSLEAIRDRGDAAWVTGAGGSSPTVEEIRAEIDTNSTQLATLIVGVGTTLPANQAILDGKLDNIPTVAEFEARTLLAAAYGTAALQTTLDGKLDNIPTVAEFEARTLASNAYFDPSADGVIVTTNNDKNGYGVTLTATEGNFIADYILRRNWANAEASANGDTANFRSLLGATAKLVNRVGVSGANLEIFEADDLTVFGTQGLTTDAAALPITALDTV